MLDHHRGTGPRLVLGWRDRPYDPPATEHLGALAPGRRHRQFEPKLDVLIDLDALLGSKQYAGA